jgi:hypothetical protein
MKKKWANRIVLVAVAGSALLAASSGLNQPQALASAGDNTHRGPTLPPNQGPIGAQAAPGLEILAPSEASRPDFARDGLGNPWDMHDANDVDYMDHVNHSSFSAAGWYGEVEQGTVANIALFVPGGPGNPPGVSSIDGSKYYIFTYELYVERSNSSDSTNHRIIYLTKWPFQSGTQHCSAALPYVGYNEWHTYTYDLRKPPGGGTDCGDTWNWTGSTLKALVVWPHEQWNSSSSGRGPRYFMYRNISLKGDNRASASFDVDWCVADSDGDDVTTSLYYDTDTTWGGATYLTSRVTQITPPAAPGPYRIYLPLVSAGSGEASSSACNLSGGEPETYTWDTSGVANGTYYVWFEVTDGHTTSRQVSAVPVYVAH